MDNVYMTKEEQTRLEKAEFDERQARAAGVSEAWDKREKKQLAERESKKDRLTKIIGCNRKDVDELLAILRTI